MSTSLALLQLVSPALPVGAFSYSEGLEVLVQRGQLTSLQDVGDWLEAELRHGVVRLESAALEPMQQSLQQWQAGADASAEAQLRDLDGWLLAQRKPWSCASNSARWAAHCCNCSLSCSGRCPMALWI